MRKRWRWKAFQGYNLSASCQRRLTIFQFSSNFRRWSENVFEENLMAVLIAAAEWHPTNWLIGATNNSTATVNNWANSSRRLAIAQLTQWEGGIRSNGKSFNGSWSDSFERHNSKFSERVHEVASNACSFFSEKRFGEVEGKFYF